MSTHTTQQGAGTEPDYDFGDWDRGYGWVVFSGVLLLIVGLINIIEGIAAISNAHFFVAGAHFVFGSLNTWGWIVLCIGVAQCLVGLGIFAKNQFARWVGVVVLGANAIAQLLMMPSYPFWSLSLFAIDIVAIFGLVAYGNRIGSSR